VVALYSQALPRVESAQSPFEVFDVTLIHNRLAPLPEGRRIG
jgi:hypothetical protein